MKKRTECRNPTEQSGKFKATCTDAMSGTEYFSQHSSGTCGWDRGLLQFFRIECFWFMKDLRKIIQGYIPAGSAPGKHSIIISVPEKEH